MTIQVAPSYWDVSIACTLFRLIQKAWLVSGPLSALQMGKLGKLVQRLKYLPKLHSCARARAQAWQPQGSGVRGQGSNLCRAGAGGGGGCAGGGRRPGGPRGGPGAAVGDLIPAWGSQSL